ncbi:uncharacterized protein [Equus caballus]|uniref:uncharacterized protein n=1 Tax=Equus caballus TaxID=9796 RepID=UPI0038B36ECF
MRSPGSLTRAISRRLSGRAPPGTWCRDTGGGRFRSEPLRSGRPGPRTAWVPTCPAGPRVPAPGARSFLPGPPQARRLPAAGRGSLFTRTALPGGGAGRASSVVDPSPALGCHHVSDDRHCSSRSVTLPRAEARDAQLQTQSHGDRGTTSSSGGETVQVPGSPGPREELSSPEWSPGAENPRAASGSRVFRALHCGSTVFSSLIRPPPSQAWSSLALAPGPSGSIWKKIPLGDIYESSSMSLRKTKFSQEETRFIHGSSWDLSFPFLYRKNIS